MPAKPISEPEQSVRRHLRVEDGDDDGERDDREARSAHVSGCRHDISRALRSTSRVVPSKLAR